jgi:Domain of unknown function (DUF4331)
MNVRVALATFFATAVVPLWLATAALAADHRDAPTIDDYSAADINDIFMFRDPSDATKLVLVMTTHPLSEPKFGSTYHYQPEALYRFYFSTNPAATPTAKIDFMFSPYANGATCPAPGPACQTFTASFPQGIVVQGTVTQGSSTGSPPPAIINGPDKNGITIFAGPRLDPFVFDLDGFNRFAAGTGGFTGDNAFRGKNTNAIVAEFPISLVVGNQPNFSVWGVTYLVEPSANRAEDVFKLLGSDILQQITQNLRQLDRMANPAVNTVLIPSPLKDAYNFGQPMNDPADFAPVILNTLKNFGTSPANTAILASVAVPDTLKFDTRQPDGYPNGRVLQDRVIDILLTLILNSPTTDGTAAEQGNRPYGSKFPFLEPPLATDCPTAPPASCL